MNKFLISTKDYDFYSFRLRSNYLAGRKRMIFINSELDKVHPCFSLSFCIDARNHLKRNGLFVDVVVMNALKLAELKNKHGSNLWIKEKKIIRVFQNKKRLLLERIVILMILPLFLLEFFHLKNTFLQNKSSVNDAAVKISSIEESDESYNFSALFKRIALNNGRIEELKVEETNGTVVTKLKVCNLPPESIIVRDEKISPVIYVDKKPFFTIEIREQQKHQNDYDFSPEKIIPELREQIFTMKGHVKEEDFNQGSVNLQFTKMTEDDFYQFIEFISTVLQKHKNSIKSFALSTTENNDAAVTLVLAEFGGMNDASFLQEMKACPNLFIKEIKNDSKKEADFAKEAVHQEKIAPPDKGSVPQNVIGRIKNPDGLYKVFYKDKDGKIKFLVQEK